LSSGDRRLPSRTLTAAHEDRLQSRSSRRSLPEAKARRSTSIRRTTRRSTSSKESSRSTSTAISLHRHPLDRSHPRRGGTRLQGRLRNRTVPHHHHLAPRTLLPCHKRTCTVTNPSARANARHGEGHGRCARVRGRGTWSSTRHSGLKPSVSSMGAPLPEENDQVVHRTVVVLGSREGDF
jgi:hypothetical protein